MKAGQTSWLTPLTWITLSNLHHSAPKAMLMQESHNSFNCKRLLTLLRWSSQIFIEPWWSKLHWTKLCQLYRESISLSHHWCTDSDQRSDSDGHRRRWQMYENQCLLWVSFYGTSVDVTVDCIERMSDDNDINISASSVSCWPFIASLVSLVSLCSTFSPPWF